MWDYADQLKSFYNQTGTNEPSTYAQYLYSGGQRVKKLVRSSGGGTETTVYIDGIMEFRADSSAHTQSVVHIGGVATIRTGYAFDGMANTTYELSNHLGSSSYRLGSTGLLLDREEYYPFGDTSLRTWEKKRYRYVGKEKDQESGLYFYGARYYTAWTCRFISTDPLAGNYPHLTSYNYASNAPINHLDVDGMQNPDEDLFDPGYSNSWDAKTGYNDTDNTGVSVFIDYSQNNINQIETVIVEKKRIPSGKEKAKSFFKGFGWGLVKGLGIAIGVGVASIAATFIAPVLGVIIVTTAVAVGMALIAYGIVDLANDSYNGRFQNGTEAWEKAGDLLGSVIGAGLGAKKVHGIKTKIKEKTKPKVERNSVNESTGSETAGEGTRSVEQPFSRTYKHDGYTIDVGDAPIYIPRTAKITASIKSNYTQVKFTWSDGTYKYTARWHTEIPNSPGVGRGNVWVVEKRLPGEGARLPESWFLSGESWITGKQWYSAISAQQNGTASIQQKLILQEGHFIAH